MRRFILSLIAATFVAFGASAHNPKAWGKMKKDVNLFLVSDLGREGCYYQQLVASLMNDMAAKVKPMAIVATGDTHHGNGVKSIDDKHWTINFENIYSLPRLKALDWYAAIGNHEYRGSTQALIDYSKVNPHWKMGGRYYTTVFKRGGTSIRLVIVDTTPMIGRYRESDKYPDAAEQDKDAQLEWLDDVLSKAKEDWIIVAGHHPIHADTKKSKIERTEMRNSINKVLRDHSNVDIYLCGHIHNFQHLRDKGCNIDYVVNTSGAESRNVRHTKRTVYCSGETGFSVLAANEKELTLYMVDKNGNVLHTLRRHKK